MKKRGRRIHRWAWARRSTAALFVLLLALGGFAWFPWFKGSTTSTRLLELIPLADPLAALEIMLATRRIQPDLLIGATLLLAFCIIMGPVFCGWVCPLGLLLDLNQSLRQRVARMFGSRRRDLPNHRIPSTIKYGVLGFVLAVSLTTQVPAFQTVSPINIAGWTVIEFVQSLRRLDESTLAVAAYGFLIAAGPALLFVFAIMLVEYLSPRLWCRALCPLGAFYSIFARFARFRVRVNPAEAGKVACRQCSINCPVGIPVMDYSLNFKPSIADPDCTRCGSCIDACPRGVLKLGFRGFAETSAETKACECEGCGCEQSPEEAAAQFITTASVIKKRPRQDSNL